MEEQEKALATLARTYQELKDAKRKRKDMKAQLKEEMQSRPAYEILQTERKELREKTNELKEMCLDALNARGDLLDIEIEVKQLQSVMDDLMANALSQGFVKNFAEMDLAGDKVIPSFKVKIKVEQMAFPL
jgi:hypothetical protein